MRSRELGKSRGKIKLRYLIEVDFLLFGLPHFLLCVF